MSGSMFSEASGKYLGQWAQKIFFWRRKKAHSKVDQEFVRGSHSGKIGSVSTTLTRSPGKHGLLPTHTNPNMLDTTRYGLGRGGVGLAEVESPELCQRLGVAGGDKTKALECASWVPAALAVTTGLGEKDGPRICFSRRRLSNCNRAHRHGQLPSL